ncbi:hypothetical protein QY884_10370 [Latilactobacillus sakei]
MQVSKLTTRFGNTKLLTVGIATTAIGMCALGFFSEQVGYALGIAVPMILMGIGQGLTLSPLTVAGVANTLPAECLAQLRAWSTWSIKLGVQSGCRLLWLFQRLLKTA